MDYYNIVSIQFHYFITFCLFIVGLNQSRKKKLKQYPYTFILAFSLLEVIKTYLIQRYKVQLANNFINITMLVQIEFSKDVNKKFKQTHQMSNQYVVEEILDRRIKNDKFQYLIHWENYSKEDSTWEPLKNLVYVKEMVDQFDKIYESINPNATIIASMPIKKKIKQPAQKTTKKQKVTVKKEEKVKNYGARQTRCKIEPQKQSHDQSWSYIDDKNGKTTSPSDNQSKEENLKILGLCRDNDGELIYLVQDKIGMRSYKTRSYMLKEHGETLVCFYECHIKFGPSQSV